MLARRVVRHGKWIEAHQHVAADLADDPLFELGNHGWLHRPLTVAGRRTDITLGHFNQPHGKTAEGLAKELPKMIGAGRHFGTLSRVLA